MQSSEFTKIAVRWKKFEEKKPQQDPKEKRIFLPKIIYIDKKKGLNVIDLNKILSMKPA